MRQSGYSLFVLLLGLASISSLFLPIMNLVIPMQDKRVFVDLDQARVALLAYTTNYVDHYGARGAGLGHLPCPDTDGKTGFDSGKRSSDGPNPPCGRERVAAGWLPRHLYVAEGRYIFHSHSRQRLLYAVSTAMINNPNNRKVNPDISGTFKFHDLDGVIAVIAAVDDEAEIANLKSWWTEKDLQTKTQAISVIRETDILRPVMRRVGSWLVRKFNSALTTYCKQHSELDACDYGPLMLRHCEPTREQSILHWLRPKPVTPDCAVFVAEITNSFSNLEGVPYTQHWFVRNRWPPYINIVVDEACVGEGSSICRFTLDSVEANEPFITIKFDRVQQS